MSKNKKKGKREAPAQSSQPTEKKIPMRSFSEFFSTYYSNMPKVVVCNLLFAVPVLVTCSALYFLMPSVQSFGAHMLVPVFSLIIVGGIFYAGVNAVSLKLMEKNSEFSVPKVFFSAVVKYFPKFLLHSLVTAVCATVALTSFFFYGALVSESAFYAIFYVFYAVFVYLMLFVVLHLPLVTIKFNASLGKIYKTSFAMVSKNAANNMTVAAVITFIAVLSYICISLSIGIWYLLLLMLAALLLILPAFVALMTNFFLYDRTKAYLDPQDKLTPTEPSRRVSSAPAVPVQQSEYVFYNGKMIKKEQLEKELADFEGKEDINE